MTSIDIVIAALHAQKRPHDAALFEEVRDALRMAKVRYISGILLAMVGIPVQLAGTRAPAPWNGLLAAFALGILLPAVHVTVGAIRALLRARRALRRIEKLG